MTDIVERLHNAEMLDQQSWKDLCEEAANEIEHLSSQEPMINPVVDRLALLDRINDLMTAGGATLTEYQANVLYAAIKALDLRSRNQE